MSHPFTPHDLLAPPAPVFSNATVQRALIVWTRTGHRNAFPAVCRYYHTLEALESTMPSEQKTASQRLEYDLLSRTIPTSPFQQNMFPNLYPAEVTKSLVDMNAEVRNCGHGTSPEEIIAVSEMIKRYCLAHKSSVREFLREFSQYAHKYRINPTLSNVAFFIQYQKLLKEKIAERQSGAVKKLLFQKYTATKNKAEEETNPTESSSNLQQYNGMVVTPSYGLFDGRETRHKMLKIKQEEIKIETPLSEVTANNNNVDELKDTKIETEEMSNALQNIDCTDSDLPDVIATEPIEINPSTPNIRTYAQVTEIKPRTLSCLPDKMAENSTNLTNASQVIEKSKTAIEDNLTNKECKNIIQETADVETFNKDRVKEKQIDRESKLICDNEIEEKSDILERIKTPELNQNDANKMETKLTEITEIKKKTTKKQKKKNRQKMTKRDKENTDYAIKAASVIPLQLKSSGLSNLQQKSTKNKDTCNKITTGDPKKLPKDVTVRENNKKCSPKRNNSKLKNTPNKSKKNDDDDTFHSINSDIQVKEIDLSKENQTKSLNEITELVAKATNQAKDDSYNFELSNAAIQRLRDQIALFNRALQAEIRSRNIDMSRSEPSSISLVDNSSDDTESTDRLVHSSARINCSLADTSNLSEDFEFLNGMRFSTSSQ